MITIYKADSAAPIVAGHITPENYRSMPADGPPWGIQRVESLSFNSQVAQKRLSSLAVSSSVA